MDAIIDLARSQAKAGAHYIDVNVGLRAPDFMAELVKRIQQHLSLPLAIDAPDVDIAAAGLQAYDLKRAGNRKPILNSITEARLEMFDLYAEQPFMPILLITEGMDDSGTMIMNKTAEQTYRTAKKIVDMARSRIKNVKNHELILDPGIVPIGSDTEGNFTRLMRTLELIHNDGDLAGIHISVGLSNFTNLLPAKKPDGSPVKSPLESAFLTMAMPVGLDTIIGSVKRNYTLLPDDHPAMQCLQDVLKLNGVYAVMRVMSYFS
ncbi:dihydropteroate synthase [candidate division KSB1 bacterium]|nr:dihydropteroate synthase [candidate division KSB1 bacterium]